MDERFPSELISKWVVLWLGRPLDICECHITDTSEVIYHVTVRLESLTGDFVKCRTAFNEVTYIRVDLIDGIAIHARPRLLEKHLKVNKRRQKIKMIHGGKS